MKTADYKYDAVDALAAVLRDRALTAASIADIFNVAQPTAFNRIRELVRRKIKVVRTKVRQGSAGPMATAFSVTANVGKNSKKSR